MDGWNTLIVAAVCKLFLRSPILTICLTFLECATSMGAVLVWLKKTLQYTVMSRTPAFYATHHICTKMSPSDASGHFSRT